MKMIKNSALIAVISASMMSCTAEILDVGIINPDGSKSEIVDDNTGGTKDMPTEPGETKPDAPEDGDTSQDPINGDTKPDDTNSGDIKDPGTVTYPDNIITEPQPEPKPDAGSDPDTNTKPDGTTDPSTATKDGSANTSTNTTK